VFVALGNKHEMRMRNIFISGLAGSAIFFHITSLKARISKKRKVTEHNVCFDFLYNFCLNHFSV